MCARRRRLLDLQEAVFDGQRGIGRNNEDVIWLDRHPVGGRDDLHLRVSGEDLCEQALLLGSQMLDQYEPHAAVGWHDIKEVFECIEASRRGAQANDQVGRGHASLKY